MSFSHDLIRFKGMGDGVRINIDADADIYEIVQALECKIEENKAFFGDGNCKIRFDGRKFTQGEKTRFTELMMKLLPLCSVSFENDKKTVSNDWILQYKKKQPDVKETIIAVDEEKSGNEQEKEFYSKFRSNRTRMYEGFVHEGMTIRSDGHLVLLGTVEKGGELIAVGNILVIGGLYGRAHAGCNGHNGSYILAMDMHPELLKIADERKEYVYEDVSGEPEPVKEDPKKGLFNKLKKNKEPEKIEEKPENLEFSAVALVKNHKIELDNFTVQTFTNPKNML